MGYQFVLKFQFNTILIELLKMNEKLRSYFLDDILFQVHEMNLKKVKNFY